MSDARIYVSRLPGNGPELRFETPPGVFKPTYTSELCIHAAARTVHKPGVTLDLGCGCGVVGIAVARLGLVSEPLYASDVSETAVLAAKQNASVHGIRMIEKVGSVFEPWQGMTFDLIIDDISAVSEELANLSPWYAEQVPCASGPYGIDLTVRVLNEAKAYLNPGGSLLFPALSLSGVPRALENARRNFQKVEKINEQVWKLPESMRDHLEALRRMRSEGKIDFDMKFGMILCKTEIFRCTAD